jgi:pimeloyl-ACP methyl ester carboxylesterase
MTVVGSAEKHALNDGRRLAYVDFGGDGAPILALHGHFGRARMFAPLAAALAPAYRVISLEQRGHGHK